jgi:uncharacterized protein (TIGR02145 family)
MKNILIRLNTAFIILFLVFSVSLQAQSPQAFNYSAVARNAAGNPIATTTIGIQISILKTSALGAVQYQENHFVNTDAYGLFSLIVGGGAVQQGAMSPIDWSSDSYYLKVGMDAAGGTNFLTMGTTQLLSVPYALHATTADSVKNGGSGGSTVIQAGANVTISGSGTTADPYVVNSTASGSGGGAPVFTAGAGVTDIDGNSYTTIILGTQEWMAENLRSSRFANGDAIPNVADSATWVNLITAGFCWYDNDSAAHENPYGKLYNWYAASDSRNICPAGWHVPSDSAWSDLVYFLDPYTPYEGNSPYAGGAMKSPGTLQNQAGLWQHPNTEATNTSGFSGLPGGYRNYGEFNYFGNDGIWWSSVEYSSAHAWLRYLYYNNGDVFRYDFYYKVNGLSVRCLRD